MAGVMTEVLSKPTTKKFSQSHIEALGDSVSARVAKACNSYPVTINKQTIQEFIARRANATCEKLGLVDPQAPTFNDVKGRTVCHVQARDPKKTPAVKASQDAAATTVNPERFWSFTWGPSETDRLNITEFWNETKFEKYPHVAPEFVARKFQSAQASGLFDSITVATIQETILPVTADPLLLGRIKGSDLRFFICQWDSDIVLDDIV